MARQSSTTSRPPRTIVTAVMASISAAALAVAAGAPGFAWSAGPSQPAPQADDSPGPRRATVVLEEGDYVLGESLPVGSLYIPTTNGNGEVGFSGWAYDGFVWSGSGPVWHHTDETAVTLGSPAHMVGIGDSGQFIYGPSVDGVPAIWSHNGLIMKGGDHVSGYSDSTTITNLLRPTMTPDGVAYWLAFYSFSGGGSTDGTILYKSLQAVSWSRSRLLASGDQVGGYTISSGIGIDTDFDVADQAGRMIAVLYLDTPEASGVPFLYLNGTLVARRGDRTGQGDDWLGFRQVSINNHNHFLVSGRTDGATDADEIIAYNIGVAMREGDVVDGVHLLPPATVAGLSLNNMDQAVFAWSVGDGSKLLFASSNAWDLAGTARLVLSTGDQVDVDGDGVADATVAGIETIVGLKSFKLAEDARLYLKVDLDYGLGEIDAIVRLDLPIPFFLDGFESGSTSAWNSATGQ